MQKDKNPLPKVNIDMKSQESRRISPIIKYLIAIITTALISFHTGGLYKIRNLKINYISQAEILALEKERISSIDIKDRQLFFGRPKDAIKHIEQIEQEMIKKGKIVLLTDSKIYGSGVSSISKEVHKKITGRLEQN